MTHRERMQERRARQLARTPGFDPIPNRRVNAAIAATISRFLAMGMPPAAAEREARHAVARSLPMLPAQRRLRAPRPSKSDNAAYRKCAA